MQVLNTRTHKPGTKTVTRSTVRRFDGLIVNHSNRQTTELSNSRTFESGTTETKETTGTKNKREKAGTTAFHAKSTGYPARLPFCIMSSFTEPARGRQGYGGQSKKGGDVTKIKKK